MAENKTYIAIGVEAVRGTEEKTTVGFLPLTGPPKITPEFKEEARKTVRGEDSLLGETLFRRYSKKWSGSLDIEAFTEAGTTKGIMGSLLKHFFGKAVSTQNGTTGQYAHMMYPKSDPFAATALDDDALTVNENYVSNTALVKNYPWVGSRIKGLTFVQEPSTSLIVTVDMFGQYRGVEGAALATPTYPAENLRLDYSGFTLYRGTITRTGTAPDFTQFAFASAIAIKPDKVTLKLEDGKEDVLRLEGKNYPNKTRMNGKFKGTLDFTVDFEDPAAGFNSYDEYELYFAGADNVSNFCLVWNTGVAAGTGDNHMMIIDLPKMNRMKADRENDPEKDPLVTFSYEGLFDATTCQYLVGLMLKNTAIAV